VDGVLIAECALAFQFVCELFSAHVRWCNACRVDNSPVGWTQIAGDQA